LAADAPGVKGVKSVLVVLNEAGVNSDEDAGVNE
jgi:hypothetical protein